MTDDWHLSGPDHDDFWTYYGPLPDIQDLEKFVSETVESHTYRAVGYGWWCFGALKDKGVPPEDVKFIERCDPVLVLKLLRRIRELENVTK